MDSRQLCILIHSGLGDLATSTQQHLIFTEDIEELLSREDSQTLLQRMVMKLLSLAQQSSENQADESSEILLIRLKEKLRRHVIVRTSQQENVLKMQVLKLQATVKTLEEREAEMLYEATTLRRDYKRLQNELTASKLRVL